MKKLKVLMVIAAFYPYIGGAEKQAQKLAFDLIKKHIDVTVLTGRWNNNLKRNEEINGLKIVRNITNFDFRKKEKINIEKEFFNTDLSIKESEFGFLKIFLQKVFVRISIYIYQMSLFLFLVYYRKNYDLIHVHQVLYPAFISTICAKILKKPLIAKVGNSGFNSDINQIKEFPEGKWQLKYILRNINKVVCTTKKIKEEFLNEGISSNKLVLIHNGVKIMEFNRDYNLCSILLYAGRLVENKNTITLIKAFSHVTKSASNNLKLILIGDGPEKDKIENLVRSLGLENNITLMGLVKDPFAFFKKCDVFILPSLVEGLSNSLIEAMSYKIPCIVSNIPGNIEVIGDNNQIYSIREGQFKITEYGILFNPLDKEGLAAAVNFIIDNAVMRKKIGENAYNKVSEDFNIDIVANKYIGLYKEVLKI